MRPEAIERLLDWRQAVLDRFRDRGWKAWLAVALALVAIEEAAMAWVGDYTQSLLSLLWRAAEWFLGQPMGLAGLIILIYVILLLGLSWWETRPQPKAEEPESPTQEPSIEETQAIQDIRAIWNREGADAVKRARRLFADIHFALEDRHYWARALQRYTQALKESVRAFESELSANRSLERVQGRFNRMYASYIAVLEWIAQMREEGDIPDEPAGRSFATSLVRWKRVHSLFTDRLKSVATDPAHQGKLEIYHASSANVSFDKPALFKLLNEAEDATLAMEARGADGESEVDGDDQGSAPLPNNVE